MEGRLQYYHQTALCEVIEDNNFALLRRELMKHNDEVGRTSQLCKNTFVKQLVDRGVPVRDIVNALRSMGLENEANKFEEKIRKM